MRAAVLTKSRAIARRVRSLRLPDAPAQIHGRRHRKSPPLPGPAHLTGIDHADLDLAAALLG
jgi:hypothetical protein